MWVAVEAVPEVLEVDLMGIEEVGSLLILLGAEQYFQDCFQLEEEGAKQEEEGWRQEEEGVLEE